MRRRWYIAGILMMALACAMGGQAFGQEKKSVTDFYLDTVVTLTAYVDDEEVLQDALEECGRYEALLSHTVEGSDVWRINHAGGEPVTVSGDTIRILEKAKEIWELSGGAFDVTTASESMLWDFTSGEAGLPDEEELEEAAARVDFSRVEIGEDTVTLPEDMELDLGGIAKGYIADRLREYLVSRGVTSAVLSLGGNVVAIGQKPDGSPWKVGIQDIDEETGEYMLVTQVRDESVVTSGIYERGFDLDGVRYHHILDPETGWPVQNELASVTVFSEESMTGDALATAVFVLGPEEGLELIEGIDGIEAVLIGRDRSVITSSGAEDLVISE